MFRRVAAAARVFITGGPSLSDTRQRPGIWVIFAFFICCYITCLVIITDTDKAIKLITDTGLPYEQAEGIVNALNEHITDFVTQRLSEGRIKRDGNLAN